MDDQNEIYQFFFEFKLLNDTELSEDRLKRLTDSEWELDLSGFGLSLAVQDLVLPQTLNQFIMSINVSENYLKTLPRAILEFPHLRQLDISYNYLESVESILPLSELSVLNLHYNALKDITGIEKLDKLEQLDLSNNEISSLEEVCNLTSLRELNMTHNVDQEIPSDIIHLIHLNKLTINPMRYFFNKDRREEVKKLLNQLKACEIQPTFEVYNYFTIGIIGPAGCGKTTLMEKIIQDEHTEKMILEASTIIKLEKSYNNRSYNLELWDFQDQHAQSNLVDYFERCSALILVFDLSVRSSLMDLEALLKNAYTPTETEHTILLIGNKMDLEEENLIDLIHGSMKRIAEITHNKVIFLRTSAYTGENVDNIITTILEKFDERMVI
ncbi:MAG: GTP-binding protein [Candidatus Heimdallarchaeota archaeon]|nr:GTP-binding protein [Candidatus Heimdallarchaeota archaeon]